MYAGCAGKTVRSLENASYLSALEVCSRQGAIQINVYLYLTLPFVIRKKRFVLSAHVSAADVTKAISSVLRKNLASVKIVKNEFNANLYLLGFPIL